MVLLQTKVHLYFWLWAVAPPVEAHHYYYTMMLPKGTYENDVFVSEHEQKDHHQQRHNCVVNRAIAKSIAVMKFLDQILLKLITCFVHMRDFSLQPNIYSFSYEFRNMWNKWSLKTFYCDPSSHNFFPKPVHILSNSCFIKFFLTKVTFIFKKRSFLFKLRKTF